MSVVAGIIRKDHPTGAGGTQRRMKIPRKIVMTHSPAGAPQHDARARRRRAPPPRQTRGENSMLHPRESDPPSPLGRLDRLRRGEEGHRGNTKDSVKMLDTYPVYDKLDCPYKAKSNNILAEMGREIVCRNCLVLDAATHLTTKRLLQEGWHWTEIYVPNACDDAFKALRSSRNCRAYKLPLSDFVRECSQKNWVPGGFGLVYLDYCSTLDGGRSRFNTSPRYDIQELFRLKLLSPHGCVVAVTLCKPKEDETHENQFCKLRHHITAMCLKYDMSIVFHEENNSYANWRTEFYTVGKEKPMKRFFRMTEESAKDAALRAAQRRRLQEQQQQQRTVATSSPHPQTRSSARPVGFDFKMMTCSKREVIVLDDDVIVLEDDDDDDDANFNDNGGVDDEGKLLSSSSGGHSDDPNSKYDRVIDERRLFLSSLEGHSDDMNPMDDRDIDEGRLFSSSSEGHSRGGSNARTAVESVAASNAVEKQGWGEVLKSYLTCALS
uniref:Uncharacterized protein n=1 Tax=Lotharella oceanica TaxID=641309 RepID=A0A7S2THT7_9EUKA|mmetsp:Transcript_14847/g.28243  ORF Transcript_14847/g.28243 Transcript_14847/m.28243 type:complete len:494 (+) Transcript_14847:111-1592(+)